MPCLRLVPIALLCCGASLAAQAAQGAETGKAPPCAQPVRFSAGWLADPEIDHSKSSAELDPLAAAARASGTQLGHVVVQTKLTVVPQTACDGLSVRLEWVQPVLRIARELPADSCAYAMVMTHEQTHVRIHREIARQFEALHFPWPHTRVTSKGVLEFAQHQLARLMDAQRRFDSPQEYARSRTVCSGEVAQLVKGGAGTRASANPASSPDSGRKP